MPLTQKEIDAAKPAAKPFASVRLWRPVPGSSRLRAAVGGASPYRFGGKRKLLSLGVYPDVSLAKARGRRNEHRELLAEGTDPSAKRQADKRETAGREINSFEYVAREWYAKQAHTWVATHASDVLRRLEGNLFPEIGGMPIAEITAPILLAAVRKIEQRGAHDLAHRVLQVAGSGVPLRRGNRALRARSGARPARRPDAAQRSAIKPPSRPTNCRNCCARSTATASWATS